MTRRREALAASSLTALLALLALSGCGGDSADGGYDPDEVAQSLLEAQRGNAGDLEVEAGTCPDEVDLEEGTSFECTLLLGGVEAPFTVLVESVTDGRAELTFDRAQPILAPADLEAFAVQGALEQGYGEASATCGDAAVIVGAPGDIVTCTLVADGQETTVDLEILDQDGNVDFAA